MRDFFTIGSPIRPKKVKAILIGQSFRYFYEHEQNQVCSKIFSDEKDGKELNDNPW